MKKRIACILTAVICLSVAACARQTDDRQTDGTTEQKGIVTSTQDAQTNAPAPESDARWIDAYEAYLTEQVDGGESWEESCFGLYYIDADDTPELVVSLGTYHGAGATITTYGQGELTTTEPIGSWGAFAFEEKTGTVVSGYMGSGATMTTVYRLANGDLTELWTGEMDDGSLRGDEENRYYSGEETVSKAEYDRLYTKYVPLKLDSIAVQEYGSEGGGVMPRLTKENIEMYFTALRDPDSLVNLRTEETIALSGTISVEQDEDGAEVYRLKLDTPFAASVQGCRFPYLVCAAECVTAEENAWTDGQAVRVKGAVSCDPERQIVSIYETD